MCVIDFHNYLNEILNDRDEIHKDHFTYYTKLVVLLGHKSTRREIA